MIKNGSTTIKVRKSWGPRDYVSSLTVKPNVQGINSCCVFGAINYYELLKPNEITTIGWVGYSRKNVPITTWVIISFSQWNVPCHTNSTANSDKTVFFFCKLRLLHSTLPNDSCSYRWNMGCLSKNLHQKKLPKSIPPRQYSCGAKKAEISNGEPWTIL